MNTQILNLRIFAIIFSIFTVFQLSAQDQDKKAVMKEKMKAKNEAFITSKLDLSEAEAAKFWPIYNAYKAERKELRSQFNYKANKDLTEKEANEALNQMLNYKTKDLDLQKNYIAKLKEVLPATKVATLMSSERQFKEGVVKNIRGRNMDKKANFDKKKGNLKGQKGDYKGKRGDFKKDNDTK